MHNRSLVFLWLTSLLLIICSCNNMSNNKKHEKGKAKIEEKKNKSTLIKDSINIKNDSIHFVEEKKSNSDQVMILNDSVNQKIIDENPLLDHYKKQNQVLKKYNSTNECDFQPDGEYFIGKFSCGLIELSITKIDGGHGIFLYGIVDGIEQELSFLVDGTISDAQIENIKFDKKYKIYWAETIADMDPFGGGYDRLFVVYKIE